MRFLVDDIDDLAVTPADLADLWFTGSPEAVSLSVDGGEAAEVRPVLAASYDRESGTTSEDRHYDLSGHVALPCDATVTWQGNTARFHVVAYHYCTISDVMTYGDERRQSPNDLGRTEDEGFRARAVAENVCDDICGRTFRATRKVEGAWAGPSLVHQLQWPALRVLTPGWTIVGDGLVKRYRRIDGSYEGTCGPSEIEYVSGTDDGTPMDVRRAVARLAASYLMVSKVPERAVYESTETGMTRYTLAGTDSTGIPDIDAVLSRHARKRWAVL